MLTDNDFDMYVSGSGSSIVPWRMRPTLHCLGCGSTSYGWARWIYFALFALSAVLAWILRVSGSSITASSSISKCRRAAAQDAVDTCFGAQELWHCNANPAVLLSTARTGVPPSSLSILQPTLALQGARIAVRALGPKVNAS